MNHSNLDLFLICPIIHYYFDYLFFCYALSIRGEEDEEIP